MADYSSSITAGATSQTAASANGSRSTLSFQNTSDTDMWLGFGAAAQVDKGFLVKAGTGRDFERNVQRNIANVVTVICAVAGKKYTCSDDSATA